MSLPLVLALVCLGWAPAAAPKPEPLPASSDDGVVAPKLAPAPPSGPQVEEDTPSVAEEGEPEAPVDDGVDYSRGRVQTPWIRRWRPERNLVALDGFGGVFLADEEHDLYDPRTAPPQPLWAASPDVGLRLGYFPLRPLGIEAEFSAVPTRIRSSTNDVVFAFGFRGQLVGQLPFWSVVPFATVGFGLLGVRSNIILLGDDIDPAFHYGGGIKVFIQRWVGLRFDARHILSAAAARQDDSVGHVQLLGAVAFTFNRAPPPKRPPPPPDLDLDNDGIVDADDRCPQAAGVPPHGCPDTDGDGFADLDDACPEQPGVAPRGCPDRDSDGDGIMDSVDACDDEPEVRNGYEDDDGCPDTVPSEVEKAFSGSIPGIKFDFNKATIRPGSTDALDRAIEILENYPSVRVRVVGHTDDVGTAEANLELSRQRAEAVKRYLVEGGIDSARVEVVGRGSQDPRVPNDSEANRAKNRRIEFEILKTPE